MSPFIEWDFLEFFEISIKIAQMILFKLSVQIIANIFDFINQSEPD